MPNQAKEEEQKTFESNKLETCWNEPSFVQRHKTIDKKRSSF